jgi:signal peptidase II
MSTRAWLYWLIGLVIFCADRATKYLALVWLCDASYQINSFVSFELVINRGISWGMFHSSSSAAFVVVSCVIVAVTMMVSWHALYFWRRGLPLFGHVCIIAGSVSNIIDRVYYCGVIDFIVLSYNSVSWPVFNVADAAIVCGVGILLFQNDV